MLSKDGVKLDAALQDNEKINNASPENLEGVLRFIMLLIGIRAANLPSPEETDVLIYFIRTNYSNHSLSELKLAFEMAITNKLDLGKDGANHYESFSCAYFSKIMNAYRKWAASEIKYLPKKETLELPPSDPNWEEVWEDYKFRAQKQDIEKMIIILPIYEWLTENKILVLTSEEKKDIFQNAKNLYLDELRENENAAARNIISRLTAPNWTEDRGIVINVQNRAKILSVRRLLRLVTTNS